MLTVGQAADRLGVTAKTIRRWDAIGKLPAVKRDDRNRRLFDPSAVDALAQADTEGAGVSVDALAEAVAAKLQSPASLDPKEPPLCFFCASRPAGQGGLCAQCFADCEPRRRPLAARLGENEEGFPEGPCAGCWQPFVGTEVCGDCYDLLRAAQRRRR